MLKLLLVFLTIYVVYRLFFGLILPLAARYLFNKAAQSMGGEFQRQYRPQQASPRREGEVRIETPGTGRQDEGEFVEYTEVK